MLVAVEDYYTQRISPTDNTTRVEAAEEVAKAAAFYDVERGGAWALEDRPENDNIPELIAAVFGETVQKEDVPVIKDFFRRHLEVNISTSDARFLAILLGTGIGGQRNITGMLTELVKLFPNREVLLYSAFGAPFKETTEKVLEKLNIAHAGINTPEGRLDLLKQRKESVKLLLRAASKSGTTPETMEGFQEQIIESLMLYSKFVYGDEKGEQFANSMITKLYDGKNLLTGGASVDKLNENERMMLAIVLDRVILATGKYQRVQQIVEGRARTGGSMFDCFSQAMTEKLKSEFQALGILKVSQVTLYNRLGGRTQIFGPDAWINIYMALWDGKNDPIQRLINVARPIARQYNNKGDRKLFGKQLAAFAKHVNAESMYVGLPTTIERRVIDSLQQEIGESIDVGGLVGYPTGIKPVVLPTNVLVQKSKYKKDDGKRLYLLITDKLVDEATKAAEEKIIKEETKKGNHVVRFEIKDHSPEEITKLFYEVLGFVEWYGNFIAAEVLANLKSHQGIVDFMCRYAKEKGLELMPEQIKNVNFKDSKAAAKVIAIAYSEAQLDDRDPDYAYYVALRKVLKDLNVWFQPGVEWGKTAAQKIAETLFVKNPSTDCRIVIDPIKAEQERVMLENGKAVGIDGVRQEVSEAVMEKIQVRIPIRDKDARNEFYREQQAVLEQNGGAYIVDGNVHQTVSGMYKTEGINTSNMPKVFVTGKYNLNDVMQKIKEIAGLKQRQKKLLDTVDKEGDYELEVRRKEHDKIDREIEKLQLELIEIASQVNCNENTAQQLARVTYDAHQRGEGTAVSLYSGRQELEDLGLEDFARIMDNLDMFQYASDKNHTDADGDVAGTRIALQILTYVRQPQGRRVVADGMVAPYWNDLSPQDFLYIYHQAYADVYAKREVDFIDLRLEGSTLEDIAKMYVLFAQANRIYEIYVSSKSRSLGAAAVGFTAGVETAKVELSRELSEQILKDLDSGDPYVRDRAYSLVEEFSSRLNKVKCILFDIGGVLLMPDSKGKENNFNTTFAELGLEKYTTKDALKQLYESFRVTHDNEYRAARRGEMSFDDYVAIFNKDYLMPANIQVQLSPKQYVLLFKNPWMVAPYSPEVVRQLKEKFSLKILSDQHVSGSDWSETEEVTDMVNSSYPGMFSEADHIRSWDIGYTKDDSKAFDRVLDRIGLNAEEVLFLDDVVTFTGLARNIGMLTATIDAGDEESFRNNFTLNELLTGKWRSQIALKQKSRPLNAATAGFFQGASGIDREINSGI